MSGKGQAIFILLLGFFLNFFPPAATVSSESLPQRGLIGISAGAAGIKDSLQLSIFNLQYTLPQRWWLLAPHVGLIITTQTAFYAYAGLGLEFCPAPRWMIIPRLSAGYYQSIVDQGLGSSLEFFSALEAAYRFKDQSRLGLVFGHMSNARLGRENPGTEFLFLTYTIPVDTLVDLFK